MKLSELLRLATSRTARKAARKRRKHLALHKQQLDPDQHDYSYNSGERQVATDITGIREDHVMRYDWAIGQIREAFSGKPLVGGDYFCGNGYGTSMLAELGQVRGVDGSPDAIAVANAHFAVDGARFEQAVFPFPLDDASHDFIVSLESVEHVPDPVALIEAFAKALKPSGCLVLSTPNEANYPFDPVTVPHHFRHFHIDDVTKICTDAGLAPVATIGQRKIPDQTGEVYELCAPELGEFTVFSFKKPDAA